MTDSELAYIAGIVDGEGTISLHGVSKAQQSKTGAYYYPFVQIANTNKKLIDWLHEKLPVKHAIYGYNRNPDKQKPSWLIQIRSTHAVEFVKLISHLLIIKRRQAEILIDYAEGTAGWNGKKNGYWCLANPMPKEICTLRHELYKECLTLNRKGPIKAEEI